MTEETHTARAMALHEAARLLFLDLVGVDLPTNEMRFRDKLRVDISLRMNEACIDFVHEAPDGTRGLLGSIAVPAPAHAPDCDCVACETDA